MVRATDMWKISSKRAVENNGDSGQQQWRERPNCGNISSTRAVENNGDGGQQQWRQGGKLTNLKAESSHYPKVETIETTAPVHKNSYRKGGQQTKKSKTSRVTEILHITSKPDQFTNKSDQFTW